MRTKSPQPITPPSLESILACSYQETEQAWRVSIADIEANGFNLEIKNPHEAAVLHRDFAELLAEYGAAAAAANATRDALRDVLRQALEGV